MLFSLLSRSRKVFRSLWPQPAVRLNKKAKRLRERGKFDEAVALLDRAIRLDSRMAEAYVNRCRCYCELHEYAKAIEDASQAIALEPEMASAFRVRAYAAYELGQNQSAISDLTKVLKLGSEDPWIYDERSCAFSHEGDYCAAIADVERFLEQRPQEARGYYGRAWCRYRLGDLNSSLADIDEAVRLEPRNGEHQFFRAGLLWELGRLDEALAGYEVALGQNCEAKEDWRNHAIVMQKWLGGTIAHDQGNYREAIEQFDAALEIVEQSHEFQDCKRRFSRLYHDRGLAWHWLGEYENALRDVDAALRLKPENEYYLHYRARLLYFCDRIEEAADAYEAALKHRCDAKREWSNKQTADRNWLGGSIALGQGDYRQAIERFDAALTADPTKARAYYDRGFAWHWLGEYENALRDLDEAVRLEPENEDYLHHRIRLLLLCQRIDEAAEVYDDLPKRDPDTKEERSDPVIVKRIWLGGKIALKRKNLREAIEKFDAALAACRRSDAALLNASTIARIHEDRADARCYLREYESALRDVDEALTLKPEDDYYLHYRARVLLYCDRIAEAAEVYQAAWARRCEAKREWSNKETVDRNWLGGKIALRLGNYRQAIERFDVALEADPTNARAYYGRGDAWHWLDEYENALRDVDEAVRLEPQNVDYLCRRIRLLLSCERVDEAVDTYEVLQACESDAKEQRNDSAIVKRIWIGGVIALKRGNVREAIEQFDAALAAGRRSDAGLEDNHTMARVYHDRGRAWCRLGEYEQALRDIDEVIRLDPETPIHYAHRASTLARLGRYTEAERDLIAARRRGPDCTHICARFAWFRATYPEAELRGGSEAVAMAHKAIELAGGQPSRRLCAILAAAYAENGQFDEAIHWQTEVLATVPEEKRSRCEAILEKYRAGIPQRGQSDS